MNNISLVGRITKAPEIRQTNSGKDVVTFSIAVKRPNVKDTTDFINCVAWEGSARYISQYCNKGDLLSVTGCLTSRKYEYAGKTVTAFEVIVSSVSNITPRGTAVASGLATDERNEDGIADDEELPF